MNLSIRAAIPDDAKIIHDFIIELAAYERATVEVEATVESLHGQMSSAQPPFECLIAENNDIPVGFALFFHNYSTWRGRRGIFVEDIFVTPDHRGRGIGGRLFRKLGHIAMQRGCARMEWIVLNWNQPSIEFYSGLGAFPLNDWTSYRLDGQALQRLAAQSESE